MAAADSNLSALTPLLETSPLAPMPAAGVPAPALAFAMSTWMALTLAASHLLVPSIVWAFGGTMLSVAALWVHGHAFALVAGGAVVTSVGAASSIDLARRGADASTRAAVVGGLLGWAAVQLVAPGADVVGAGLMALVESVSLGLLLSSFTQRAPVALALGATFQIAVSGLTAWVLAVLL